MDENDKKGDDLHVSTWAIYFACCPINGIGGGQHSIIIIHVHSSMNKYNSTALEYHVDAQELLHIARHKTSWKPSVAHQYTALLTLLDHNMDADYAYQGCLPSCELHSHDSRPLTVTCYSIKVRRYTCRLRMQIMPSWDCACVLRNLSILRMRKFSDCTNVYIHVYMWQS